MLVELICDTRERAIQDSINAEFSKPAVFAKTKGEMVCNVKQVEVGDYAIEVEGRLVAVLERKTLKDYGASFKDNRHANKAKLLNARIGSNCKIYYIIEGPLNPDYDTEYAGIKYKNILASIHDLMIKDGIFVIRTQDGQHTARELRMLCESHIRVERSRPVEEFSGDDRAPVSFEEVLVAAKLTLDEKLSKCRVDAWKSLPGIGNPTAIYLATQYRLADWIKGELKVDNFTFNGRRNNKVGNLLSNKPTKDMQISILACSGGLTVNTATEIIEQYTLDDLLADVDYSSVRFGSKQVKLTKARVAKIKSFLTGINTPN